MGVEECERLRDRYREREREREGEKEREGKRLYRKQLNVHGMFKP